MLEQLSMTKWHKMFHTLSHFLCMAILLTSLFTTFSYVDGFYYFMDEPSGLVPQTEITTQFDYYPMHTGEQFISKTVFPSQLSIGYHRRLPMRFPMPPTLFLLSAFLYFLLLHRYKVQNSYPPEIVNHPYTIRYIHDQNGETYHSFLF